MHRAVLLLMALLPAGCVSLSGGACSPEKWRAVGFEDGLEGVAFEPASERRAACEKKLRAAAPDLETYLAGWREGRDIYCTPESGFAAGARGDVYRRICEGEAGERFLAAYEKGKRLLELQASSIRADEAISRARVRLWDIRRRMSEIETVTVSTAVTHEERLELVRELKSLREESRKMETSLESLSDRKSRAAADLATYRSTIAGEEGALRPSNASY